jgi:hypothetical protein
MWDMGIGLIEIMISEREVPDRDVVAAREDAMEEREKTGLVVAEPIVTNSAGFGITSCCGRDRSTDD